MLKWAYLILFILFINTTSSGQNIPGAYQNSLSFSNLTISSDPFSLFLNPANLSLIKYRETAFFYSPSPFGLKELSTAAFSLVQKFNFGAIGIGYSIYGFELFKEQKMILGYSYSPIMGFSIGLSLIFQNVNIKNYGQNSAFNTLIGVSYNINKNLLIGFSFENLFNSSYGGYKNQIPIKYNLGMSYKVFRGKFFFSFEKEFGFRISPRFGFEYNLIEYFSIRLGSMINPNTYSGGIGINYSIFNLDYAIISHSDLGLTHQIGLRIKF